MSEFQASNFIKENGGTPDLLGKTELTSPYFFVPPSGTTPERPESCAAGTLRFNTDIGTLEVYRGDLIGWEQIQKRENQYLGGDSGNSVITTSTNSNRGTGVRGLFAGGFISPTGTSRTNIIDYITISTLGDASDFGDRTHQTDTCAGAASNTRGVIAGGYAGSETDVIEFVTISSTGDALDFGDLENNRRNRDGCGDSVRGLFGGGYPTSAAIDYLIFASLGDSKDFGDLTLLRYNTAALSSTTRGVIAGGNAAPSYSVTNIIDFVTIRTTGNATDFGDLTGTGSGQFAATSNSTRGLISISNSNGIDFITIATLGNSLDFGDASYNLGSAASAGSSTRAIFAGGGQSPAPNTNSMDFVEILTTGNGLDFGDLTDGRQSLAGFSNGHGGL